MQEYNFSAILPTDIATLMPVRPERSNKSTFGRVVAVCGSYGMSGAAYLAALAAYRIGCGLVELVTPHENRAILQALLPEAILTCYDAVSPDNSLIAAAVSRADAVIVGCGLGHSDASREVLETVLSALRQNAVLDADALNILAAAPHLWAGVPHGSIITPHPGEMSRLTGIPTSEILESVPKYAAELARERNVICVLKDHKSVISDGKRHYINGFGNSGMATAGAGDVLAGILGGLLAQSRNCPTEPDTLRLAALGVLIHSLAGDVAAQRLSEYSVMASDIANAISSVLVSNM